MRQYDQPDAYDLMRGAGGNPFYNPYSKHPQISGIASIFQQFAQMKEMQKERARQQEKEEREWNLKKQEAESSMEYRKKLSELQQAEQNLKAIESMGLQPGIGGVGPGGIPLPGVRPKPQQEKLPDSVRVAQEYLNAPPELKKAMDITSGREGQASARAIAGVKEATEQASKQREAEAKAKATLKQKQLDLLRGDSGVIRALDKEITAMQKEYAIVTAQSADKKVDKTIRKAATARAPELKNKIKNGRTAMNKFRQIQARLSNGQDIPDFEWQKVEQISTQPQRAFDEPEFWGTFGLPPKEFAEVKAVAESEKIPLKEALALWQEWKKQNK